MIAAPRWPLVQGDSVRAIVERCCGLDVHQAKVVACLLVGRANEEPRQVMKTFTAMTSDLIRLRDWLKVEGCTHVTMESTGVYWMAVYAILEGEFELVVGNATHIQNVPGRKTDAKDSEWLADLLRHGLIRKSFVPPKALRQLRDKVRYRRKLVEAESSERNRLLRLLETANIKLASVATDVFGVSGRKMLRTLIDGTLTPTEMAKQAKGRLRTKIPELVLALDGRVDEHHRFLLEIQLERVERAEQDIAKLDERIDKELEPYREQHERLKQIPGVDAIAAASIIAELGVDMAVFPSAQHAAAWAGVSPGNHESAGKRKNERRRSGNVHLTTTLVQAAMSAAKTKGSYLKQKYGRLKSRRGAKRAAVAIAHKILVAAYHMLARGTEYRDLGAAYLDRLNAPRVKASLVKRLEQLGYLVSLQPVPAA